MTKKEIQFSYLISVIILLIASPFVIAESIGWLYTILFVVFPVFLTIFLTIFMLIKYQQKKDLERYEVLMKKYRNGELVNKIMRGDLWQGQTAIQLMDALGQPRKIDIKVLKTKKKEIWKYNYKGGNRYGLRVMLDDDRVVSWDYKSY